MIASFPMYDWPEVREATDAWWRGLSRHLGVAIELDRNPDHFAAWRRNDLFFSQTCGYPFTHEFKRLLKYVATPHYAVPGCEGANYSSSIFARVDQPLDSFRGGIAAVNNPDSMSGMLALKLAFAPFARSGKFFASAIRSGGHINSMLAVRDGTADVCAIDAVCVAMARRYRPDYLEGLVEIALSPSAPSLPYVTRSGDIGAMRAALVAAFADPELQECRGQLFLSGHSVLRPKAYERITDLESEMQKAGGLELL
ncbi:MAG TPA: PhnD/SsuA/transferrin family substrate-binding protein [Aestuariivirga sp.]|nr:PhnD/SsuA/transferrin family substrate-binding protein [Aestuariivirga sp.]